MKKGLIFYPQMSQLCIDGSVRLSVEKLAQAQYVIKTEKFALRFMFSKKTTLSFHVVVLQRTGKEIYKDSKRTCKNVVPLLETFVW